MISRFCLNFLFILIVLQSIEARLISSSDCKCTLPAFPRIVGGEEAQPIPWQISLAQYGQHICGGTILNDMTVMTAAHWYCVVHAKASQLTVRVGLHRLNDPNIDAKTYGVSKITVHSRYFQPGRAISGPGDIALLKIDGPIPFSKDVQPACLPERFEHYDDRAGSLLASGWGSITRTVQTPSGQLGNARLSNVLKEAEFDYLNPKSRNLTNVLGIDPNSVSPECSNNHLICIKPVVNGDSVCNGDSGGPLMHTRNGIATVVGVASYVTGLSTSSGYVVFCNGEGAYSRVSSYLTFIRNHLGDNYCQY